MSFRDEHRSYSASSILRKTKAPTKKDGDKDDKKPHRQNSLLSFIAKHKHDVGKHNNGRTTGFEAVEKKGEKEYGSKEAGERVAGAVYQKMKKAGKV